MIDAEDPAQIFDAANTLGIHTVIDPFIPEDRWQTGDQVAQLAERVNTLAAQASSNGLEFGYHNHYWELTNKIDNQHVFEVFAEQLEPAVVLEVDTYWAAVGGADTPAVLRRLADRVRLIHVKDGTLDGDVSKQEPAGAGEIDVTAILAAAPQAIRIIEFDAYAGDLFDGIAQSLAWLHTNDR